MTRSSNSAQTAYYKFQRWVGTKQENEQREYLFSWVYFKRNKTNANWGEYLHYFYDVDLTPIGPYANRDTAYAAWLMYMEARR